MDKSIIRKQSISHDVIKTISSSTSRAVAYARISKDKQSSFIEGVAGNSKGHVIKVNSRFCIVYILHLKTVPMATYLLIYLLGG